MKILHIVPTYLPAYRYGAATQNDHDLNKWLVKRGVDVTVYSTNIDGRENFAVPLNQEMLMDGVKCWYFPASFPRRWFYSNAMRKAIREHVKEFDLVYITSVWLANSALGAHYARKFGKPYIISPRGSLMREPLAMKSSLKKKIYLQLIEKRNLAGASAIHFTVPAEEKEYREANLPLKKSFTIPHGFDEGIFPFPPALGAFRKKYGIPDEKKIILFLGRINWKKGFDTLIPAFAKVAEKEPNALLVIAGGDEEGYMEKVKVQSSKFKVSEKVIFTGMLLGEEKTAVLQDSQVFVLPSYSENFGVAVVEAMYFELPVVITPEVGIAPSVGRAKAGSVVLKDADGFATAIIRILEDPAAAQGMGINGKNLVLTEFSMDAVTEKMISAYNETVNVGRTAKSFRDV